MYSVALLFIDDLSPRTTPHVRSECCRDENARRENIGCSAFAVHPRSPAGTIRTAVSSRFQMRSCEILKRSHRYMTRSCRSLRCVAMSTSLGPWRVQVTTSFHETCRLRRNCRVHRLLGSNSTSSSRSTRRYTCCQVETLRLSLPVRFAGRERANGGKSMGGLPPKSRARPSCHLRNVTGATGSKSSGTNCFAQRSCKRMFCDRHAIDRRGSP